MKKISIAVVPFALTRTLARIVQAIFLIGTLFLHRVVVKVYMAPG